MLGHLCALVPGEGPAELFGQGLDHLGDRVSDGFGAVAGQGRTVLDGRFEAMTVHAGQMQKQGEPGRALDKRADGGALQPDDVGVGPERPAHRFDGWVSPARPPNRTCDFHRIRLSTCSGRQATVPGVGPLVHGVGIVLPR